MGTFVLWRLFLFHMYVVLVWSSILVVLRLIHNKRRQGQLLPMERNVVSVDVVTDGPQDECCIVI